MIIWKNKQELVVDILIAKQFAIGVTMIGHEGIPFIKKIRSEIWWIWIWYLCSKFYGFFQINIGYLLTNIRIRHNFQLVTISETWASRPSHLGEHHHVLIYGFKYMSWSIGLVLCLMTYSFCLWSQGFGKSIWSVVTTNHDIGDSLKNQCFTTS